VKNVYGEQVCLNGKKKVHTSESDNAKIAGKTKLTAFLYAKGIIHHQFVPEKQIVNRKFHEDVIKRLVA
jgi:hypothetical protein